MTSIHSDGRHHAGRVLSHQEAAALVFAEVRLESEGARRGPMSSISHGNPDTPTPDHIFKKPDSSCSESAQCHGYSTSRGFPSCAAP